MTSANGRGGLVRTGLSGPQTHHPCPPSRFRELQLLRAARRGDRGARERLVTAQLGTVRAIASRYQGFGLPVDDLLQEGSLGLLEAIDRFDPSRHSEFHAFARFRVRRAIRNALTNQARLVRLPKQIVERRRMLTSAEAKLAAETGRTPTAPELAATTGLALAAVIEAQRAAITPMSLDDPVTVDGTPLEALIADTAARDPERELIDREQSLLVRDALAHLSSREREIVSWHFGIDAPECSMADIADGLHLSERRTRTLEQDALRRVADDLLPALSGTD